MRIESSIITSLSELRAIEQQRISDERAAIDRARVAEHEGKLAAERAIVQAEEARLRAERDERIRIEQAHADSERELRLRIETTEASERARLQLALDQQRLHEEVALRRDELRKKRPAWMVAVTCLAVMACAGLGWYAYDRAMVAGAARDAELHAQVLRDQARAEAEEARQSLDKLQQDLEVLDRSITKAQTELLAAETKAERDRIKRELVAANEQKAEVRRHMDAIAAKHEHDKRVEKIDVTKCTGTAVGCLEHH